MQLVSQWTYSAFQARKGNTLLAGHVTPPAAQPAMPTRWRDDASAIAP